MIDELILTNEYKIESFDIKYYLESKSYAIAAALSALETTNEVQKNYFNLEASTDVSANVLRLYALLQSLFVSIDSLYALAFSLTKSKNFININRNKDLRDLKYIRNDVVGHPANRSYNSNSLAYCILDNTSISKENFSYDVYTGKGIDRKTIDIISIVNSYYNECNSLLSELFKIAKDNKSSSVLTLKISSILDTYSMNGNYKIELAKFKKQYLSQYPNASANQHRVLWRLDLIDKLMSYKTADQDIEDLIEHSIGLELIKIYQLVSGKLYKVTTGKKNPYLVSAFYRFLNKNRSLAGLIESITDINHPLFRDTISKFLEVAKSKNTEAVIKYLDFINSLCETGQDELVYAITLPIKEYKKKIR